MAEINVLTSDKVVLNEIKQGIVEADTLRSRISELSAKQKQLEKEIDQTQRAMASEIESTLTRRQIEIESSYSDNIAKTRARIKMVKEKRDKYKETQVAERIKKETVDINERKRSTRQELKGLFKRHRIPRIFNNDLFFSLFMPDCYTDFLIIFIVMLIFRIVPDTLFYTILYKEHATLWLYGLEGVVLAVGFILYTIIFFAVRQRKYDALLEAKAIRKTIYNIKDEHDKLVKDIRSDKNEEGYGLGQFDDEIAELEARVIELIEQQKQSLTAFESEAKANVTAQINAKYSVTLETKRKENSEAYDEQRRAEERLNVCTVNISNKYEPYMDKEMLNATTIDALISIMDSGEAATVADAINVYKKRITEAGRVTFPEKTVPEQMPISEPEILMEEPVVAEETGGIFAQAAEAEATQEQEPTEENK